MSRRLVALVLLAAACSQTETVTVPAPDTTAPLVIHASPDDAANGVALNARVSATFSETMDRASLETSFSLAGPAGAIAGSAAASLDARSVTFTPDAPLDPDSVYTASVATSAKDAAGNRLSSATSWTFRTGVAADLTAPRIAAVSPPAGSLVAAASTSSVAATFDEPIDCAVLPPSALAVYEQSVPIVGYVDCHGDTLEFVPFPALPTQTSLVAILSPLILDIAGNPLGAAKIWAFDVRPWTRQLGTTAVDEARSIATDVDGNIFVAGFTDGNLDGNASAGGRDVFVVKYDPSGAKQWTRQIGSTGEDYGYSVTTDATGNVFVAGYTSGGLDGNGYIGGLFDAFVVKYDASGAKHWSRQIGTTWTERCYSVATDATGSIFVAGFTMGDLDGNTSAGGNDLFVVKYDPSGTRQWTRQFGSAANDNAYSVATDLAGNIFVAGMTRGGLDGNVSAGGEDIYLVKYDPSGAKQWTRQLGSNANDLGYSVAIDLAGNVFVAGWTGGGLDGNAFAGGSYDVFVVKYGPTGAKQWTRQLGSTADDVASSVATDIAGNVFVAGRTLGNLDGITSAGGSYDLFVVKYDPSGAEQWIHQLGSMPEDDLGYSVATDVAGNVFVTGYTTGGVDGNSSAGGTDLFVVKYGPDGRKR